MTPTAEVPPSSGAPLAPVSRTLLIPLAARAHGAEAFPWLDCGDADAAPALARLHADVRDVLADRPTVLNVLWRTQVIKEVGRVFFAEHPHSLGVCLGCGLSNHFQWLDQGLNRWLDVDLPDVIALRERLLGHPGARRTVQAGDLTRCGWWDRLGLPQGREHAPVFLLCEGVLMYLSPAQVAAVLREFGERAPPGSRFVLDTMSHVAVGMARYHPSVGATGAEFLWGLRDLSELTAPHPRLRLLASRSVSECYGWPGQATEALWRPWIATPLYGMVTLGV